MKFISSLLIALFGLIVAVSSMRTPPPGYVAVPGGYYKHSSCVHGVPSGSHLFYGPSSTQQGKRQLFVKEPFGGDNNENSPRAIPHCEYPTIAVGRRSSVSSSIKDNSQISGEGWQVFVYDNVGDSLSNFTGNWNVPSAPSVARTQILYTFTGLEDSCGVCSENDPTRQPVVDIIQPVLQFGATPAGGGHYWGLASWYVTATDVAVHSSLINATSGGQVHGVMAEQVPGSGSWTIISKDVSTDNSVEITIDKPSTKWQPWAFVTLEVYTVSACVMYPTEPLVYTDLQLWANSSIITTDWKKDSLENICGENIVVNTQQNITINFHGSN